MPTPTVYPFSNFRANEDADALRAAMKVFGTNKKAIIEILAKRSNSQRQEIARYFLQEYGRDLVEDLKSKLSGKFEDFMVAIMRPPVEYFCRQLHKAVDGAGTDESALIEILCTRSNDEIRQLVKVYEDLYERPLVEHMCGEASGHFRRLLTLIATGVRDPPGTVDPAKAREQAENSMQPVNQNWALMKRFLIESWHMVASNNCILFSKNINVSQVRLLKRQSSMRRVVN